jgi:hypothetical protein
MEKGTEKQGFSYNFANENIVSLNVRFFRHTVFPVQAISFQSISGVKNRNYSLFPSFVKTAKFMRLTKLYHHISPTLNSNHYLWSLKI